MLRLTMSRTDCTVCSAPDEVVRTNALFARVRFSAAYTSASQYQNTSYREVCNTDT